jgi:hypothetical protein
MVPSLPGPDRRRAELALDYFRAIDEGQSPKAAECLPQDREGLLAWYDCPAEPWRPMRTTNPVGSLGTVLCGNLGTHRRHDPRTFFSDPGPQHVPGQYSGRSPRIPESSQGPLRGSGPSDVYTEGMEGGSSRRGLYAGVAMTWVAPEVVSALPQALPTTFLRFLDSTYLALAFWTRGGFVAIGFSHGCAWCLATLCLREWLGRLKAVPQTTDHPGYTLHNMPKHTQLLAKAIHTSGGKHPIVPARRASFQPQSYIGRSLLQSLRCTIFFYSWRIISCPYCISQRYNTQLIEY